MATGSGKTDVAVRSAEELRAGRVLVLVPSLDPLAQTETAWREGGARARWARCRRCRVRRWRSRTPRRLRNSATSPMPYKRRSTITGKRQRPSPRKRHPQPRPPGRPHTPPVQTADAIH
ncbi:DEAD/DEAH box helicase family protein [Streptomyces sp. WM6378]|uniref:DEAD/DEAH box helicase family protein n=1 Tax=Streptomyces sp. WM6378 TaxID=1415557 RepID=UPI003B638C14